MFSGEKLPTAIAKAAAEIMGAPAVSFWIADEAEETLALGAPWWRAHGLRSFLGIPLLLEGSLLAVLALNGHAPFRFGRRQGVYRPRQVTYNALNWRIPRP